MATLHYDYGQGKEWERNGDKCFKCYRNSATTQISCDFYRNFPLLTGDLRLRFFTDAKKNVLMISDPCAHNQLQVAKQILGVVHKFLD